MLLVLAQEEALRIFLPYNKRMLLDVIARAYWILLQAFLTSLVTIFISVPIAVLIVLGYAQMRKRKIGLPRGFLSFLFATLLFPMSEALIGAACYDTQDVVASNVSILLFGLSILFTVAATFTEKGRRLFVFGIGCSAILWTLWAILPVQMMIYNSWL